MIHRTLPQALLSVLLMSAASAATAAAQGPVSTGTVVSGGLDQRWQVSAGGGAFSAAPLVVNNPGWANFTGPQAGRWISATSSGSGGALPYIFRTTFDLSGFNPATASLAFTCGADDTFNGYRLNGGALFGGGNGAIGSTGVCGAYALGTTVSTISSGFLSGVNTLEFLASGNSITDGFIMNVERFSATAVPNTTAPEPGTWALLGTGLVAIGGVARRRRARA